MTGVRGWRSALTAKVKRLVALAAKLGFMAGFTTRCGVARADEPALERSQFVVLARLTAAELAQRITYAWPR